jgi:pimeloyl-ACP methyl ester carboxylesterase
LSSEKSSLSRLIGRAAVAVGILHVVNLIINKQATSGHLLRTSAENRFNWRGVNVHYTRTGRGPVVLLLHDLHPASGSHEWSDVIRELSLQHTVYAIDLPGCCRSDRSEQLYTNFYYVEFLKEFMETMALDKVTLIGSNLSAPIALMTAVYEPKLISKILMINPPSLEDMQKEPASHAKLIKSVMELPVIGTGIYNMLYSREQIDLSFTEKFFYNPFHETEELVDQYYESAHLGNGGGRYFAASLLGGYLNMNVTQALKTLKVPAGIIEGGGNENFEWLISGWKELKPDINVAIIPKTKLLPQLEEPKLTSKEILSFIDQ